MLYQHFCCSISYCLLVSQRQGEDGGPCCMTDSLWNSNLSGLSDALIACSIRFGGRSDLACTQWLFDSLHANFIFLPKLGSFFFITAL